MTHPVCRECNKEIWGIAKVQLTLGVEPPTFLHSVCYERLKNNHGLPDDFYRQILESLSQDKSLAEPFELEVKQSCSENRKEK